MKPESDENKEKLVMDGNAFYEIDMECVRNKNRQKNRNTQLKNNSINRKKKQKLLARIQNWCYNGYARTPIRIL